MDTSSPLPTKSSSSVAPGSGPPAQSAAATAVAQALVLLVVGAGTGLGVNYTRLMSGEIEAVVEERPGAQIPQRYIDLPELTTVFGEGIALFVDVRHEAAFEAGHVPGAVNLPHKRMDEAFAAVSLWFRDDVPVVLYGEKGKIGDVLGVQKLILDAGCKDRQLFKGGFDEWRAAGMPVETGPARIWGPAE